METKLWLSMIFDSKGANAKAKANATQGIPEMLLIANEKEYEANRKDKHSKDAKHGWYSYVTRFALPVYDKNDDIERYNVFRAIMLVRHAEDRMILVKNVLKRQMFMVKNYVEFYMSMVEKT